jgi:hypothetical protein
MVNNVNSNLTARFPDFKKHIENRTRADIRNVSKIVTDKIEISKEAKAASKATPDIEKEPEDKIDQMIKEFINTGGMRRIDEVSDKDDTESKKKLAAMKIAMRIANGDNVPIDDHRWLAEYDSVLYKAALKASLVAENDDPKDYDSLIEEMFGGDNATSSEVIDTEADADADGTSVDTTEAPTESVDVYH